MLWGACGRPLEFADWLIDVPDGTPVHEYAPVPIDRRDPDAIRLYEELVVGADLGNPDEAVFEPGPIAATDDGTMFVADFATSRVQMYDRDGRFIRTLGNPGQGPGEFGDISWMTIAGDSLVIDDTRNDRWSVWTPTGEHVADRRKPEGIAARSAAIEGLADGTLVVRSSGDVVGDDRVRLTTRIDLEGEEIARFDEMVRATPIIPDPDWTAADVAAAFVELIGQPTRIQVVGARELVYVSPVDEYQVLSFAADGTPRWALRVAGSPPAISMRLKDQLLARARSMDESVTLSHFDWPPYGDAVEALRTDGAGRLYVILDTYFDGAPPNRLPTDVYAIDGERIASGFIPVRWNESSSAGLPIWDYAAGDYVYGRREDESGELVAVRYRLTLTARDEKRSDGGDLPPPARKP